MTCHGTKHTGLIEFLPTISWWRFTHTLCFSWLLWEIYFDFDE